MKIGDKVRFLSETGGGTIAGFQGKDIVLVEDEDGFQIPTSRADVVVIGAEDYSTSHMAQAALQKQTVTSSSDGRSVKALINGSSQEPEEEGPEPADRSVTFRVPVEERKGGNVLNCYLAFVPIDVKEISQTRFECYFVNDSNYYVHYAYMAAEGNSWTLQSAGEIEPNTKELIEELGREQLNQLGHVALQITAYKREKVFILKPSVNVQFRIDPVKFYKLHTFQTNDFFEQPALLYTIIENDCPARPLVIDAKALRREMYGMGKTEKDTSPGSAKNHSFKTGKRETGEVVVDLHAHELLDTTAGMSSGDILNYQLEIFRKTLEQYKDKKGQKLIFIHGKGEGVLRQAIIHELNYRYKRYTYQDASFREYGYGATQITIR